MKVIYAGTFDPITNGHLDQIERAAKLFSKVIIAVAKNPTKRPLFELAQRVELVQQSLVHLQNIEVVGFSGLLIDLAKEHQTNVLIRGIRSSDDVEYEIQLAQLNEKLSPTLQTLFLPPSVNWRYLSSTQVREIYYHQGDVSQFVPTVVNQALLEKC
ncbi:Phosphopantetheine adenylyltransferase [Phocoenobacter uteri]|uniref:Phosphopantetheine adenylyltransferase n=1 Tax=Phocoenobacter uteri TaxID=146806 RepID=A0A379CDE7_9PAST|nr:pantetheine-phosphate adenylyltransferase [Phocoenobacter uteri]MDG6881663.1 pantetheine-phosphate adenylyltransferase [Phocoenobacter uteri]SUB59697.1 Phosphopantetheine adenylyltransferase [Phocoenobacter uteri]